MVRAFPPGVGSAGQIGVASWRSRTILAVDCDLQQPPVVETEPAVKLSHLFGWLTTDCGHARLSHEAVAAGFFFQFLFAKLRTPWRQLGL